MFLLSYVRVYVQKYKVRVRANTKNRAKILLFCDMTKYFLKKMQFYIEKLHFCNIWLAKIC